MSHSQSSFSLPLPSLSTHSLGLPTTTYPAPPPTTHTLSQKDRTRLLKSTRKLTSVLGSTPQIASSSSVPAALSLPREPPTPRTKKSRRTGRVFTPTSIPSAFDLYNSSNTSLSSFESSEFEAEEEGENGEEGYVFVRRGGATGYHYHHLDIGISLPQNHRKEAINVSLVPSSSSDKPKGKKGKGGKALPPPLLLRLRAVPVDNGRRDSVLSTTSSLPAAGAALSPLSPTFPPPPATQPSQVQKIKKLNKLSRTFGEPVPPELVFPSQSHSQSRTLSHSQSQARTPSPELLRKVEVKPQGPRLSARERRVRREEKRRVVEEADLDFKCGGTLPPALPRVGLAMALPLPTPPTTQTTGVRVTQHRSRTGGLAQTPRRAPRPRSLTLLSSPSLPSLPSQPPAIPLPAPPTKSLPALPLPLPVPVEESSDEEGEGETPPTSTDDLPESLKAYFAPSSRSASPSSSHAVAHSSSSPQRSPYVAPASAQRSPYAAPAPTPLSPRHAYSTSTPNLPRPRPRTSSSGASRTSAEKTHHRIPLPLSSHTHTHTRARTLDNRSSRAFYGISSSHSALQGRDGEEDRDGEDGEGEDGFGHRREREWSGEWNLRVGDVRRLLRELKAR